jgi:excisionase family DNA binding protein
MTKLVSNSTGMSPGNSNEVERLLTIQKAAEKLGVHVWALRRAIKAGTIPAYAPFNGRKLVRLTEVAAAINAAKVVGANG